MGALPPMHMTASHIMKFRAEPADQLLIEPLDLLTVIYQRRSGITHIVAEPACEILAVMGDDTIDADEVARRLAVEYEFDGGDAVEIIGVRLAELAHLGLIERIHA